MVEAESNEIGCVEMMEVLIGRMEWDDVPLAQRRREGSAAANAALIRCFPSAR